MRKLTIRRGGNGVFEEAEVDVVKLTKTQVVVAMPGGGEKRFSRRTGYPVGEPHGFGFRPWYIVRESIAYLNREDR